MTVVLVLAALRLMRVQADANLEADPPMSSPAKPADSLEVRRKCRGAARFPRLQIPEVWIRFLLAIVGLGLAFGAALFSTVTRESGNLWGTLILASAALLLAVLVGLTTVPYLARRVAVARIRNVFDYDVTRAGIVYVVIVVVIGVAALNTGNNLLYIIVAAMLAAILCSGVASALVLRGLELDVRVPQHVFAGRPAMARIVLRNPAALAGFVFDQRGCGPAGRRHQEMALAGHHVFFSARAFAGETVAPPAGPAAAAGYCQPCATGDFSRASLFPLPACARPTRRGREAVFRAARTISAGELWTGYAISFRIPG